MGFVVEVTLTSMKLLIHSSMRRRWYKSCTTTIFKSRHLMKKQSVSSPIGVRTSRTIYSTIVPLSTFSVIVRVVSPATVCYVERSARYWSKWNYFLSAIVWKMQRFTILTIVRYPSYILSNLVTISKQPEKYFSNLSDSWTSWHWSLLKFSSAFCFTASWWFIFVKYARAHLLCIALIEL